MKTLGVLRLLFLRHKALLRRIAAALCTGLCVTGVYAAVAQQRIAERVLRFHVLANSDSEADQAAKRQVRDAILAHFSDALLEQPDAEAAARYLERHQQELLRVAEDALARAHMDYPVTVTLDRELFPQKVYGRYRFPAGRYTALRVCLGEAAGKNWWCVLYPPLCVTGEEDGSRLEEALTPDGYELISGEDASPQIKFRLVEWWQEHLAGDQAYATNPD